MASDYGDETKEIFDWLVRNRESIKKHIPFFSDTETAQEVEQGKTVGHFGNYEHAKQFAAICRENDLEVYALADDVGEGFIVYDIADKEKIADAFDAFVKQNRPAAQQIVEDVKQTPEPTIAQVENTLEQTKLLPAPAEQVKDAPNHAKSVAEKVQDARENAISEADFIERCEAQGLEVTESIDGELKFTENGWFDVRADTLKEKYGVDATHDSFVRTPIDEGNPETRAETVKSHDGMDVDNRTRVVESVTHTEPERDKQRSYNLKSERTDCIEASKQLEAERGGGDRVKDISDKFNQVR